MERKLVKQGANTLFVSLPSNWIKGNELTKGSLVEVKIQNDDKIIISAKNSVKKPKQIFKKFEKINFVNFKSFIDNCNRQNYNVIKIKYDDKSELELMQSVLSNYFIGLEIIDVSLNYVLIQNISSNDVSLVNNMENKIFFILSQMIDSLEKKDYHKISEFKKEIFKTKSLLQRIFINLPKNQIAHKSTFLSRLNQLATSLNNLSEKKSDINIEAVLKIFDLLKENQLKQNSNNNQKIIDAHKDFFENIDNYSNFPPSVQWEYANAIRNIYLANWSLNAILLEKPENE